MSIQQSEENMPKSCQDIAYYSDKLQYGEASFLEKVKLKLHILYCERCKKYNIKNIWLTKIMRKEEYKTLNNKDLEEIQRKVNAGYPASS